MSTATVEMSRANQVTTLLVCKKHAQTVRKLTKRVGTETWNENPAPSGESCLYCTMDKEAT